MKHNFLSKTKIPKKIPPDMQKAVDELKRSKDQMDCLRNVRRIMSKRNFGHHLLTIARPGPVFLMDHEKSWETKGFMHCHNINWLVRILLVES